MGVGASCSLHPSANARKYSWFAFHSTGRKCSATQVPPFIRHIIMPDMHITDTDAHSYQKKEFAKVLEQHEKEKKDKYLQNCLEMRKDFTPMIYSVDGIAGREARNAEKRLATHLASKWKREYSQMVYYVRVRMAIAVVRANSLLIRGSRDRQRPRRPLIPDGAALGDWRTWSDR